MKFIKALGKLIAFIFSIIIGFISILMIIYLSINKFVNTDNLKQIINTKNVLNIEYEETTFKENIIQIFEEFDISYLDAKEVVEGKEFEELLDNYLEQVIDYYLNNEKLPEFDNEKLSTLLELAMSKNNKLSEIQKQLIKASLINEKDKLEESIPNRDEIMEDKTIKEIRYLYNSISVFYFVGGIIILMFLIFIFTYSLYKPFKYLGISLIFSSLIFIIFYLFKNTIINYSGQSLSFIINNIFNQMLTSSLIILIAGFLSITIYLIINHFVKVKEVE